MVGVAELPVENTLVRTSCLGITGLLSGIESSLEAITTLEAAPPGLQLSSEESIPWARAELPAAALLFRRS